MESSYLKWFVIILVASLLVAIVWNVVLDVSNRAQIHDTIRKSFEVALSLIHI